MSGASDKIGGQGAINPSGTNAESGEASTNVTPESVDNRNIINGIPRKSSSIRNEFFPISSESGPGSRLSANSQPESSPSESLSLNGQDTLHAKLEGQNGDVNKERAESLSSHGQGLRTAISPGDEEWSDMQQILSNIFGRARQEVSEEEKTRHVGLIWKNLTVKGVGVGATLQPTNSDIFLGLPRLLWRVVTGKMRKKKPVRTILDDFTVRYSFAFTSK